jgi:hypothetical protein
MKRILCIWLLLNIIQLPSFAQDESKKKNLMADEDFLIAQKEFFVKKRATQERI